VDDANRIISLIKYIYIYIYIYYDPFDYVQRTVREHDLRFDNRAASEKLLVVRTLANM